MKQRTVVRRAHAGVRKHCTCMLGGLAHTAQAYIAGLWALKKHCPDTAQAYLGVICVLCLRKLHQARKKHCRCVQGAARGPQRVSVLGCQDVPVRKAAVFSGAQVAGRIGSESAPNPPGEQMRILV